jgi:hypothetical protein
MALSISSLFKLGQRKSPEVSGSNLKEIEMSINVVSLQEQLDAINAKTGEMFNYIGTAEYEALTAEEKDKVLAERGELRGQAADLQTQIELAAYAPATIEEVQQ